MYQLYWAADSGALAPQIILEEAAVDYERCAVDLDQGEETEAAFLAINPRGQVPALVLEDGTVLTESAAMLLHIADSHPAAELLPPLGSCERAMVYRWLFYAAANLYEGVLRYYYSDRYTTVVAQADQVRDAAEEYIDNAWSQIEDAIVEGPYFLGQTYCVLDSYLLMLSNWHDKPEKLFAANPKLQRLCVTVRARVAVKRIWPLHFP
jgi:glutathione S-transferase/GST-like protein